MGSLGQQQRFIADRGTVEFLQFIPEETTFRRIRYAIVYTPTSTVRAIWRGEPCCKTFVSHWLWGKLSYILVDRCFIKQRTACFTSQREWRDTEYNKILHRAFALTCSELYGEKHFVVEALSEIYHYSMRSDHFH